MIGGQKVCVVVALQKEAAPEQPPAADSEPTLIVIPPPVKFRALLAGSFEARPQLDALMFGLPWKLIWPVKARTQGLAIAPPPTLAIA